ncbi:MAG: CDP-alcohol phosphatidyltransferase family protein [Candidatus Saccharimonadaceae bacterium]|nr:CDP-alcohol phosphatidyltransferase family protein [Candidatus Saccharimonadaceae bacterium]
MLNKDSQNFQNKIDRLIDKLFLWAIPHSVRPNHITVVRFVLVPVVYWLLDSGKFDIALVVFLLAASTDFIDGAMARTRNQITDVGKVIDPIADKLLIMTVLLSVGIKYLIVKVFLIVIILEMVAVLFGAIFRSALGRPLGANFFGKIKMILQCLSVGLFIAGLLTSIELLINFSEYTLVVALVFALLSGLEQARVKILDFQKRHK